MPYDRPVEAFKQELFTQVDAGFTSTVGGVAETGGLLLMPGPAEPRLMSLVPPIHLALLRASTIQDTFWSAVKALGWGRALPPNALMISGPSKTADIEQTLAYGVHGPKRLIVVLVDDLA
jgi:L-lactate dehydrogenase complex protein LldG